MMRKLYSKTATLFIATHAWSNSNLPSVPSAVYQPKGSGKLAEVEAFKDAADTVAAERLVPAYEPAATAPVSGPQKTGVVHTLREPIRLDKLAWNRLPDGGQTVKVRIRADRAKRLRLHLRIEGERAAIQIRLKGNASTSSIELVSARLFQTGDIWLPITDGDEAMMELYAPSPEARQAMGPAVLDKVNYLYAAAEGGQFAALGLAPNSGNDVVCDNFSDLAVRDAIRHSALGVAKINSITRDGESYSCTGTLLADRDQTYTPWFATANHCASSQAEADNMSFEWFFQAASCTRSETDSRYQQTYGGAQILWSNASQDTAFLKLNAAPPSGVTYLGWDARSLSVGQSVWGIHHPLMDHTMYAGGTVDALAVPVLILGSGTHSLNRVNFSNGSLRNGSSGSGLFTFDKTNLYWRGVAITASSNGYGFYSQFDTFFGNITQYLYPAVTAATAAATYPEPPPPTPVAPPPPPPPRPDPIPAPATLPVPTSPYFIIRGKLEGDSIGDLGISFGSPTDACEVNASTGDFACYILLTANSQSCLDNLTPSIIRYKKSNVSKAKPQILENFAINPPSVRASSGIGKSSPNDCNKLSLSFGQPFKVTKMGLTFEERATKILDCAEKVAGEAFPTGAGTLGYDAVLGNTVSSVASIERTYATTGWGSGVVRKLVNDTSAYDYFYKPPKGKWERLGDLEAINRYYCHAW